MKVAIPVSDGLVETVFSSATTLVVIDFRGGRGEYSEFPIMAQSLKERAQELSAFGVDVVLCAEICHSLKSMISARGIDVHTGLSGPPDEVFDDFIGRRRNESRPRESRLETLIAKVAHAAAAH
jgi:predicted Fe-Mo cluster-binding NifX family protein